MSRITDAGAIRQLIVASLCEAIADAGLDPNTVADDFDLHAEGVIDSFGFVQLISGLELQLGFEIDLEQLDAEDLTVLGPLSRHIALLARTAS